MDLDRALGDVEDIKQMFLRELMQSVLQQSNFDGLIAYGGIAACERIARRLTFASPRQSELPFALVRTGYRPRVRKAGG